MHHLLEDLGARGHVSADDVLVLRQDVFGDSLVDLDEARQLIWLATEAPEGDPEWSRFYCEIMADYFSRQKTPRGYVTESDARFLIDCYGPPETASEIKVSGLVHLFKQAISVPECLIDYGLDVIRAHVLADGRICEKEVEQLRVFLFAAGGHSNIAVTRKEAELLCDLNDASRHERNAPAWIDLFMKAIGNYLMVKIGYQPPCRQEALRRTEWLNDQSVNPGRFVQRMVEGGFRAIHDAYRRENGGSGNAQAMDNKPVSPEDAAWLAERIGRDGEFDDAEKAVISHLKTLQDDLPPELEQLAKSA